MECVVVVSFCHVLCTRDDPPFGMAEPDGIDHQCIKQGKNVEDVGLPEACKKGKLFVECAGDDNGEKKHDQQTKEFILLGVGIQFFLGGNASFDGTFPDGRGIVVKLPFGALKLEQEQHKYRIQQGVNNCFEDYFCYHVDSPSFLEYSSELAPK